MATYVKETTRGKTLHLLKFDNGLSGQTAYLDATHRVRDGMRVDRDNGYKGIGPMAACEIQKAGDYADYVAQHATPESLHSFQCQGYYLFTEKKNNAVSELSSV